MDVSLWEKQKYFLKSELCWGKVLFLTADAGLITASSTCKATDRELWEKSVPQARNQTDLYKTENWSPKALTPSSLSSATAYSHLVSGD